MDEAFIKNWNAIVPVDGTVFHIGDFTFYRDIKKIIDVVFSLNGKIILIPGNHDNLTMLAHQALRIKMSIVSPLQDIDIQVEDEKLRFVLCHYAMRVWNKSHFGAVHLYGHSHGTLPDDPNSRSMDVGVDSNNYAPISIDDVLLKMYNKTFQPVDHHQDRR